MAKGKKGQNRKTVISTTAQWPKEKKGQNRQTVNRNTAQGEKEKNRHSAVLLITVCHFVLFFHWPLCCSADHYLSI
jgi:hypothetical protein